MARVVARESARELVHELGQEVSQEIGQGDQQEVAPVVCCMLASLWQREQTRSSSSKIRTRQFPGSSRKVGGKLEEKCIQWKQKGVGHQCAYFPMITICTLNSQLTVTG